MQRSVRELLEKYLSESLSPEETRQFREMLEGRGYEGELEQLVEEYISERSLVGEEDEDLKKRSYLRLETQLHQIGGPGKLAGMRWLRKAGWAAAVILVAGAAAYLWFQRPEEKRTITAKTEEQNIVPAAAALIAPGGDKAVLTLADGSTIILDSAMDGALASQGNTQILKNGNGELVYRGAGRNKEVMMNTITTPAGGQYQVVLPDGTKARLNAGSSITFPAAFTGSTRAVSVAGEIYFDVTRDQRHPFVVTANNTAITVLGTSFNINAYKEEAIIRTTLVEGAVRVDAGGKQLTLKPGQQAKVATGNVSVMLVDNPNMEQVLAWTNGLFNFEGSDLSAVMRQLEHWYDITVNYEGKLPAITFKGKMYRNVHLSDVLEGLQEMGLRFKMEGKQLIVSGKDSR